MKKDEVTIWIFMWEFYIRAVSKNFIAALVSFFFSLGIYEKTHPLFFLYDYKM